MNKKKIGGTCVVAFFSLPLLLFLLQIALTYIDKVRLQPPGEKIQLNGDYFHYSYSGVGDYAVILESGMGLNLLDWSLVQPEIAKFSRVFSYDRAGQGWSDESPYPRTSEQMAKELHSLLQKVGVAPPYILVGHSLGGVTMQIYYSMYPQEVKGILLLDSTHPGLLDLPKSPEFALVERYPSLYILLASLGIARASLLSSANRQAIYNALSPLPPFARKVYLSQFASTKYVRTLIREKKSLKKSLTQLKKKDLSFGATPLTLVIPGKAAIGSLLKNNEELVEWQKKISLKWESLQKDMLARSSRSELILADDSDHMIQRHAPHLVVQAIKDLIDKNSPSTPSSGVGSL